LEYRGCVQFGSEEIFVLREPSYNDYIAAAVKSDVIESGVGIVVIGRTGSESKDLSSSEQVRQTEAGKNIKKTFSDRHYLQLSPDEENRENENIPAKASRRSFVFYWNCVRMYGKIMMSGDSITGIL